MLRFASSVLLQGGMGAADRYRFVWGALTVFRPHWVSPAHGVCFPSLHCSGSRLLYMERALYCVRFQFSGTTKKRGFGWACLLCLPRPSGSGSPELDGRTLPGCGAPSPLRPQPQFPRACAPVRCMRLVSIRGSWPLAATLPADVDHPESQESLVRNWRPFAVWLGCCLWGHVCPFPSPLPPASGGAGLVPAG